MDKLVTAVVPTMGEKTLPQSLASLEKQTIGLADIIVVEGVSPFPRAMNQGIQQVKTPFMLQCDADMILDPDCVETLAAAMVDATGVAIGYLSDEILGDIQAVKLYRSDCLRQFPFKDTVASDTDGIGDMIESGYQVAFASRATSSRDDVLGLHRPGYDDPAYVYGKFSLMGSVVRRRNSRREYEGVMAALKSSRHEQANFALTAFCHGLFTDIQESGHKPFENTAEFRFLNGFFQEAKAPHDLFAITRVSNHDREQELAELHGVSDREVASASEMA